ncbi:MAG: DUF554 domain-containing protein [Chloroflexi bacterium]|nr:DUF554 domain-containing protein [Chloroflexota bacterium]
MNGTLLNVFTVALGSALGLLFGNRLSEKTQATVIAGLGLAALFAGIDNAGKTGNLIIPLLSIVFGALVGEWLDIDGALNRFGAWLQSKYAGGGGAEGALIPSALDARERFILGYVTASLLFCVGPLTFLGAMLDGMGNPEGFTMLALKSVLDGFAALAFASTFGVGVAFSIITILLLQGSLALAGSLLGQFLTTPMINETTAVGGLMMMGIGLILLDIKKPRIANFLPGLVIAPLIVALAAAVGVNIYP